ncbi:MAG: hypothetical protein CUN55_11915 [Phototrophicales bacterium]|nr:MAG: hypothetical protein CUN55_11915 [Phototrophicales bacterium]
MNASYSNEDRVGMNGHFHDSEGGGDNVDVNVEDTIGTTILGLLFFFVLLAFLRSLRRERQLLVKLGELQAALKHQNSSS